MTAQDPARVDFVALPAPLVRPANLPDVKPPALLLQTSKYGAPFLVAGEADNPLGIFLNGDFRFHTLAVSEGQRWSGLAVENIEFEVDVLSATDGGGFGRVPGALIRRGDSLAIGAVRDARFGGYTEVPILKGLPKASSDEVVVFPKWHIIQSVETERRVIWQSQVAGVQ